MRPEEKPHKSRNIRKQLTTAYTHHVNGKTLVFIVIISVYLRFIEWNGKTNDASWQSHSCAASTRGDLGL